MHFCFLFRSLEMGGIQTLMARMGGWLVRRGHDVSVIASQDGPMRHEMPTDISLVVGDRWFNALRYGGPSIATKFLQKVLSERHVDVFYCFSQDALWVAAGLLNAQPRPSKCLAGMYGPEEFGVGRAVLACPPVIPFAYPESFLFLCHLPTECRIFMNEATRRRLQAHSHVPVNGHIWPLPIDNQPFRDLRRVPTPGLIVSVGRLVPMKEYNLWMIDVVYDLIRRGHNVKWEVYGNGPYYADMDQHIRALGLDNHVTLKGEISYGQLPAAFTRAWVFVGMGTSLIEAGFAGVPAIEAEAFDSTPMTHGFLHQLPDYCCGETIDRPKKPILELLEYALQLGAGNYAKLALAQKEHAARFELERLMPRFLDLVREAPLLRRLWRPQWAAASARCYSGARTLWHRARQWHAA